MPNIYRGRKKVRTIGYCIYCKSRTKKLTEEHIIPFSLDVDAYLEDASCLDCADVTKRFELHVGRTIYGHYRIHNNIQTRHPGERPTVLPAQIARQGVDETIDLAIKDHPYFLGLPIWDPPGVLLGRQPFKGYSDLSSHVYWFIPPHLSDALAIPEGENFEVKTTLKGNADQFARFLAKIAYCDAMSHQSLDGFRSLALVDIIMGRYSCPSHFIGVLSRQPPPPPNLDGPTHEVTIKLTKWMGMELLLSHIRLFARTGTKTSGMPTYAVVLGAKPLRGLGAPDPSDPTWS